MFAPNFAISYNFSYAKLFGKMSMRRFCLQNSDYKYPPPPKLNIKSSKDGVLDDQLLNTENQQLLDENISKYDRDYFRQEPKANIFRRQNGIVWRFPHLHILSIYIFKAFYKDDIRRYFLGYPRDPDFDRFLPEEVQRLLSRSKDFYILDIREEYK